MILFNNKSIEVHFGLFGPALSYHTNNYYGAKFIISLILFKLYIDLPWEHKTKISGGYAAYGFCCCDDPDRMIFQWGNYYKVWYMPWVKVVCARYLQYVNGGYERLQHIIAGYDEVEEVVKQSPERFVRKGNSCAAGSYTYYVMPVEIRRRMFLWCDWKLFTTKAYEVKVMFDKSYNGLETLLFDTETDICMEQQVELQIIMADKDYTDF